MNALRLALLAAPLLASAAVVALDSASLASALATPTSDCLLVEFYAPWCVSVYVCVCACVCVCGLSGSHPLHDT
jgi:hypothetical protein